MPRRSLCRPQEGPPSGETIDTLTELRMRRSLRASLVPDARRSTGDELRRQATSTSISTPNQSSETLIQDPQIFYNCLKLAAENKINPKNAFSLGMIDYLSYAVRSNNSPLGENFQLAGCSLEAATKIYVARVDNVASHFAEFALSMSMMHKPGKNQQGDEEDGNEYNAQDDEETKKKKKKARAKGRVLIKNTDEIKMDLSKSIPKSKMFAIVGNLMDQPIDKFMFSFGDRAGQVQGMSWSELESSKEPFEMVKIKLPAIPDEYDVCPTFADFNFKFDVSLDATYMTSKSTNRSIRAPNPTDSPRLTLNRMHLDPSLEAAANLPFDDEPDMNDSLNGTIIEEVAACGAARRLDVLADDPDFEFAHQPLEDEGVTYAFDVTDRELNKLHGPHYWKFKKPVLKPVQESQKPKTSQKKVNEGPIDFYAPLPELPKRRVKTFLSRDTMLRWDEDKHVLPTEDLEDVLMASETEPSNSILDVGLVRGLHLKIAGRQNKETNNDKTQDKVPYNFENEADKQDYCPFPGQPMMPSDDEEEHFGDADSVIEDPVAMQNMFDMLDRSVTETQQTNVFSESRLISEPLNLVTTVAPVWKVTPGVNMRLMEALIWKNINIPDQTEEQKLSNRWTLRNLHQSLPEKVQKTASTTSTLYALLNLANKKCLEVSNNDTLSKVTVRRLTLGEDKPRKSRVHPALFANE